MESEYRKGYVYIQNCFAGIIAETEEGYIFSYDKKYLKREDAVAVSLTLPLREAPYETTILFPFFDGLIPEGWLLGVVSRKLIRRTDLVFYWRHAETVSETFVSEEK